MLEQRKANLLLAVPKIYTVTNMIDLTPGTDCDYQLESNDGYEVFIFDVRIPRRNMNKARFQLHYQRSVVLVRLCRSAPHTNPDEEFVESPHFHTYREGFDDKCAESLEGVHGVIDSLEAFCRRVNLPVPRSREVYDERRGRSGPGLVLEVAEKRVQIPKSRSAPERVLQVLNTPRRDRVDSLLFAISDTRPSRGSDVAYYALVNDSQRKVQPEILHALAEYSVKARTWSARDELVDQLAA